MALLDDIEQLADGAKSNVLKLKRLENSGPLRAAYAKELALLAKDIEHSGVPEQYRNMLMSDYARFWLGMAKGGTDERPTK